MATAPLGIKKASFWPGGRNNMRVSGCSLYVDTSRSVHWRQRQSAHANYAVKSMKPTIDLDTYKLTGSCTDTADYAHTHRHTQNYSGEGNRLPLSATFHSGLSWPGVPGLRPTTAYALGKHYHLGYMESHTRSQSAIQRASPVTHAGCVINGVWALDMTALLSLCDKEPHTQPLCFLSAVFVPIACVHPLSTDSGLLSSRLGILLRNITLA